MAEPGVTREDVAETVEMCRLPDGTYDMPTVIKVVMALYADRLAMLEEDVVFWKKGHAADCTELLKSLEKQEAHVATLERERDAALKKAECMLPKDGPRDA